MRRALIWTFLVVLVFINYGCPKPCIEANYSFVVHAHITHDIDSINMGDTIYLISSFPTTLIDQNTHAKVEYSGATNIGTTLGVLQLSTKDSLGKDAVFDFNYFSLNGRVYNDRNISSPDGVQQLIYEEVNGNYELKIGLIPKTKGTYVFVIGNGISTGRNNSRSCEKANFNITFENTKQHIYLLYNWNPNAQFYGDGQSRVYYFTVK